MTATMKPLVIFLCFFCATTAITTAAAERKTYIVYMGDVPEMMTVSPAEHHHNILTEAIGDEAIARKSRLHSYGRSIYGFAASLLPHEAARLREHDDVVSVFLSRKRKLVTTRSWDFLGFTEKASNLNAEIQSDTIVGLLDSGIDIGAPSFNDEGYGPVPRKWKGKCTPGKYFPGCNRKVIGARYYNLDKDDLTMTATPYDFIGHGSHTSSTAAGNPIPDASLYGLGKGTARGGVPRARIAMYRVCGTESCSDANILAGFDDAIKDGVDVFSISLGGVAEPLYEDVCAIGSFHAMKAGIPVVLAAGNSGPGPWTVSNVAPWAFTVAATNIDREFLTKARLGNGEEVSGIAVNSFVPPKVMVPLIAGSSAQKPSATRFNATECQGPGMIGAMVKGKIVFCYGDTPAMDILRLGGIGALLVSNMEMDIGFSYSLPATHIDYAAAKTVADYIQSTENSTAMIFKSVNSATRAPLVASYSSRGPQRIVRNILKPDISGPGTDILAAYSRQATVSGDYLDKRRGYFNIISGTSMATPHVAAAVTYVKTFHPDWSPAAIKSALMTTAKPMDLSPEQPLDSGSGLIDPIKAVHPGLVYHIELNDYIGFLCKEGYNSSTISKLNGKKPRYNCADYPAFPGVDGLNYPSMHLNLPIDDHRDTPVTFHRTVTYVGLGPAVFKAQVKVQHPELMVVKVTPETLSFNDRHEKMSFTVDVEASFPEDAPESLNAFLEWDDNDKHVVRSPIVVYKPTLE